MPKQCDWLISNARLATMQGNGACYGAIENASIALLKGKIIFIGANDDCPYQANNIYDANRKWITPGLIDCHTHLVYGGNRAQEFEQRLNGASYAEIAKAGGGINSTVQATRSTSEQLLLQSAHKRAARLCEEGVTTIEVKSGYGLDIDTELKMLRVAKSLELKLPVTINTTYLGAHAIPPEFQNDSDGYIEYICSQVLPIIATERLAATVDVFCESIGFTPSQCEKVFIKAKQLGLNIKAHAEQLSDLKGAKLASIHGAFSVDHIEYLAPEDVHHLKQSDTVAVLLPGAFYYLNDTVKPPVSALRRHKVPIAVATDLNPGSSPIASLLTVMNMACILFGLTPEEVIKGVTINAALALNEKNKGKLMVGYDADLCIWDIEHPSELVYGINQVRPSAIWQGGIRV